MLNKLINSIDKLHTTELGIERIRKNLEINTDNVVSWCKEKILLPTAIYDRKGKNWYIHIEDIVITVNATSYTIITAHRND